MARLPTGAIIDRPNTGIVRGSTFYRRAQSGCAILPVMERSDSHERPVHFVEVPPPRREDCNSEELYRVLVDLHKVMYDLADNPLEVDAEKISPEFARYHEEMKQLRARVIVVPRRSNRG